MELISSQALKELERMLSRSVQGSVVNISSTAARVPRGGNPAYGVAKAAQDRLTQDLAFELAPKGVRVNSVLPGEVPAKPKTCTALADSNRMSCTCDHRGFRDELQESVYSCIGTLWSACSVGASSAVSEPSSCMPPATGCLYVDL